MYCFFISFSLLILLISCSEETEIVESPKDSTIESPTIFKHNDQEFKIFTYYQEFEYFLESAKKQPDNLEELYKESVIEPISLDLGLPFLNHWMLTAPKDIEAMEESIDTLIDKQELINDLIMEALKDSADQLPGGNKSVYLLPSIPEFKSELKMGKFVTGEALNKSTIYILIDPSFLEEELKYTIAHEYHHVVAMENDDAYTLLDRSILEGKADTFAKMLYPNVNVPWVEPLTGYSEEQGWKLFMENLDSFDTGLWYEFYKGNHYKGLDMWSNYKIGYQIMQSFLEENPDVSVEEWTKMSAKDILIKSKYKDE
jgi:uncharacterized protein YjaZ